MHEVRGHAENFLRLPDECHDMFCAFSVKRSETYPPVGFRLHFHVERNGNELRLLVGRSIRWPMTSSATSPGQLAASHPWDDIAQHCQDGQDAQNHHNSHQRHGVVGHTAWLVRRRPPTDTSSNPLRAGLHLYNQQVWTIQWVSKGDP